MSQPPEEAAAERAVLGSILMAPNIIPDVLEVLSADDFYTPKHALIFVAACNMYSKQEPVDAETVRHQLQREGNLVRVGGGPYLVDLLQATPTSANVLYYAKAVAETAKLRRLDVLCTRGKQLVASGGADYQEIIGQFETYLDEAGLTEVDKPQGFSDLFEEWVGWQNSDIKALPTPWPSVNEKLAGGLHKQRLYIVGARPGCGKSVLGLNIITQIALAGYKGIVFSLEMPKMEVMSRMLASGARADYGQITAHRLDDRNTDKVHAFAAMNPEFQSRIMIDDQTDHTLESIMSIARAQKRRGLDFIFIDYVQLLNSSKTFGARYEELGMMSKTLKQMARKLDVVILLAAQAGRDLDKEKRLPTMRDLRESGNLEADADVVLMLSRGGDDRMPDMPLINVSLVKNRTGIAGDVIHLPEHFDQARIGA